MSVITNGHDAVVTEDSPALFSGDDGDVARDVLGLGIDEATLELAEEVDELDALEGGDDALDDDDGGDDGDLPDETAAAPAAPGGLTDQPTRAPSRKVKAAGLGGLIGAIPAPLLALLDSVTIPEATLSAITAALTLFGALAAAYLARENAPEA